MGSEIEQKLVVSFGGGTNSVAGLLALEDRGYMPDLILFADTGGEKPETYETVKTMNDWLRARNWPQVTTVKKVDKHGDVMTLEENCLDKKMLPSIAYGFKACSQKFKIAPQDKFVNNWHVAKEEWKAGRQLRKVVFFDADEPRRAAKDYSDHKYDYWYPLIEWGMGRDDCIDLIKSKGLPLPGKSACFFCPNSKIGEIRALNASHPDLMARAVAMEENAELTSIKGLGRGHFAWKNVIATDDMFNYPEADMPCECML